VIYIQDLLVRYKFSNCVWTESCIWSIQTIWIHKLLWLLCSNNTWFIFTSPLMRYNFTIVYGLKTVFYNLPNCMDCKVVVLNCIRLSILDMTEHTRKLVTIKPATTCTIETWCLSHYVILNLSKISRRCVCLSELRRDLNQI